jgi:hypothetical protein
MTADIYDPKTGKFTESKMRVIGEEPRYIPYVNIEMPEGGLIVSITKRQMDALIRAWRIANGETE